MKARYRFHGRAHRARAALTFAALLVPAAAALAGEAANSVTHVVRRGAAVGVKSYGRYRSDWPHVELHVRPDGVTVKFPGTRSWKVSRGEYAGWVLDAPADAEAARAALKKEHLWRGAMAVGRRLDVRVRGRYSLIGGGGGGGGGGAPGLGPIWTVLSLDCDIDVDSDRDGEVEVNNYSPEADEEDRCEDYSGNPVGALTSLSGRARLVVRRLSAAVRPDGGVTPEGRPLRDLVEGSLRLVHIEERGEGAAAETFPGRVSLVYEQGGRKLPALDREFRLVPPLWRKIVGGEDVELEMAGAATGRVLIRAMLAVRRKGSKDEPVEFIDEVRALVCGCEFVPYVDINDRLVRDAAGKVMKVEPHPGRGELPNIAVNAVLPEALSGTGAKNRVRAALKVTAPPGEYDYRIDTSSDVRLSVPPRSRISVEVADDPANGFSAISNAGKPGETEGTVVVTGGLKSTSADRAAFLMACPKDHPPLPQDVIMVGVEPVVVYAFEFRIPEHLSGIGNVLHDGGVVAGRDHPNFDGDPIVTKHTRARGGLKGLEVEGYEKATEMMPIASLIINMAGLIDFEHARGRMNDSGGTTLGAFPAGKPYGRTVLFSKTSGDRTQLNVSLGGRWLANGDQTDEIMLKSGTVAVVPADRGTGRLKKLPGSTVKIVRNGRVQAHQVGVHGAGGPYSSSLVGREVETQMKAIEPTVCVLVTDPPGAKVFSGKAHCNFRVRRGGQYRLYVGTGGDAQELGFQILCGLPLSYKGFDFGRLVAQAVCSPGKGETHAGMDMTLAFGLSPAAAGCPADQVLDTSVNPWMLKTLSDPRPILPVTTEPVLYTLNTKLLPDSKLIDDGKLTPRLVKMRENIVFRVQYVSGKADDLSTHIPIWTAATCGGLKSDTDGCAWSLLDLDPVKPYALDGKFFIWSFSQQEGW